MRKINSWGINLEIESGQELTRFQKCCVLCGCESIFVALIVLVIGAGNFYYFLVIH